MSQLIQSLNLEKKNTDYVYTISIDGHENYYVRSMEEAINQIQKYIDTIPRDIKKRYYVDKQSDYKYLFVSLPILCITQYTTVESVITIEPVERMFY